MAVARQRRIGTVVLRPPPGARFTQIATKRHPLDFAAVHDITLEYAKKDANKVKEWFQNWYETYLKPNCDRDYQAYLKQERDEAVPTEKAPNPEPAKAQGSPRVIVNNPTQPLPQNAGETETKKEGES